MVVWSIQTRPVEAKKRRHFIMDAVWVEKSPPKKTERMGVWGRTLCPPFFFLTLCTF